VKPLMFDVFGRNVLVEKTESGWVAFYLGSEGKRRHANNIFIPSNIPESEIQRYLGDLCHEWASEQHPDVRRR